MRRHWCALDGPRDDLRGHRSRARVHMAVTSRRIVALSSGRDAVARLFFDRAPDAIRCPCRGAPFVRRRVARISKARIGDALHALATRTEWASSVASRHHLLRARKKFLIRSARNLGSVTTYRGKLTESRGSGAVRRKRSLKIFSPANCSWWSARSTPHSNSRHCF